MEEISRASASLPHCQERVTGLWNSREADHLNRFTRQDLINFFAAIVEHRADSAAVIAGDNRIADMQRSAFDNDGSDDTTTTIKFRFHDRTARQLIGIALQLQHFGLQQNHFLEFFDAHAGLGGDFDEDVLAAPFLLHQDRDRPIAA